MKKVKWLMLAVFCFLVVPFALWSADIQMHGDLNNRFMLGSNHDEWFNGSGHKKVELNDDSNYQFWGEAKYRIWWDAATNEGKVKGVWAVEIGGIEYGKPGSVGKSVGGGFSGDGVNIETRWLYTDFKLPWNDKLGMKMGLFPLKLNKYFWAETQMGVQLYGDFKSAKFILGWSRGDEYRPKDGDDDTTSLDSFYLKVDFAPVNNFKFNFWADYVYKNLDDDYHAPGKVAAFDAGSGKPYSEWYEVKYMKGVDFSIIALGLSGSYKYNNIFANFDFIYEGGSIDEVDYKGYLDSRAGDYDLNAYFAHVDLGYKYENVKITYTFWYASGDDDEDDSDFDAFMSVDVDISDSLALMEGGFTDDDYFVETPYIGDKGFIMNKLAIDWKVNKKLQVGTAFMYMMTAEDIEYIDNDGKKQSDDNLGFEVNAYLKYKLYNNLEFAVNAGYFVADDAMDYFEAERDGDSDENIFISTARVRYKF